MGAALCPVGRPVASRKGPANPCIARAAEACGGELLAAVFVEERGLVDYRAPALSQRRPLLHVVRVDAVSHGYERRFTPHSRRHSIIRRLVDCPCHAPDAMGISSASLPGGDALDHVPDNLDLERWFRLPRWHEPRMHSHRHAGVRVRSGERIRGRSHGAGRRMKIAPATDRIEVVGSQVIGIAVASSHREFQGHPRHGVPSHLKLSSKVRCRRGLPT